EQGEAPVDAPDRRSHYRRFRAMFEGADGVLPFPVDGSFLPSFDVGTDPKLDQLEGPALETAVEFDGVYATMLQALLDYLAARRPDRRQEHATTAIDLMMEMRRLAKDLVELPQRPGSTRIASPVFSSPTRTARISAPASAPGQALQSRSILGPARGILR